MPQALLVHCSEQMPDAMHERTNGRTNADFPSTSEEAGSVGNARRAATGYEHCKRYHPAEVRTA